jgi:Xaa-Pro dipeptidase
MVKASDNAPGGQGGRIAPDYQGRLARLQARMSNSGVKGAVLTTQGTVTYYSGAFCPWRSALVFGQTGDPTLITMAYDAYRIRTLTWVEEVVGSQASGRSGFVARIVSALGDRGIHEGPVGVELETGHVPGVITAREMLDLQEALPRIGLRNVLDEAVEIMVVKEDYEIEQMRRAAEIADVGVQAGFDALRPGISEFSLTGVVEHAMRDAGDMFTWSVTGNEIASGYRQCYPECATVIPSNKMIQYGDVVTIDIHPTTLSGYRSDLALNAVVGPPSDSIRRLGDSWEEIVRAEIEALKPGRTVHDVARDFEDAVKKAKLDPRWTYTVGGHGLGTEARMPPAIRKRDERLLQPRTVVVLAAFLIDPGVAGIRLELPVLLTESGNEVLCKTPLKLHVACPRY